MEVAKYIGNVIEQTVPTRYLFGIANLLDNAKQKRRYERYREKYDISPSFEFNGPEIKVYGKGRVHCGSNSYIGRHSNLKSAKGSEIYIGENVAMSHFIFIFTKNRVADQNLAETKTEQTGDVYIGSDSWIGSFVYINQGCSIGNGAVVGAHSVVTRDVPPHSIAVGSPAKVIKFKSYLDESEREKLIEEYWESLSTGLQNSINER
nr:acyltransferase [Haloferax larsenii]